MRHHYILVYAGQEFVQTHYTQWGSPDNPHVVCCVHGLTRNCRDFDELALALSSRFRVVCVDVAGRGLSGHLQNPQHYHYATYACQLGGVLAHINADQVQWVGTSMGGILGMLLAAAVQSPVRKLVISDVGPVIPKQALEDIAGYLGKAPVFTSQAEVEQYLRQLHSGFGHLSDQQWQHLAKHSSREEVGRWYLRYDPAIAEGFGEITGDADLRPVWEKVRCPVLVLRGANSELLPAETAADMARGANVQLREFADVGHAPMMMSDDQIETVREFLGTSE